MSHAALPVLRDIYWRAASRFRQVRTRSLPALRQFAQVSWQTVRRHNSAQNPAAKRLLLLAWEFPPVVSGGVYRPLSFVRHAASAGWDVEVVCGKPADPSTTAGQALASRVPSSVSVQRIAQDIGAHPWPLPHLDGGLVNALSLFREALARVRTDTGTGVILASGPPFLSFVAARWLARRTGRRLVLDYRDEWTQAPFSFVAKNGANPRWEQRCLAAADLVIFTTPSQLAHAKERFPELAHKRCAIVYNGWEPDDFAEAGPHRAPAAEAPITLAYLGNFGAMAAPDAFLETLAGALTDRPALRARLKFRVVGHKRPDALKRLRRFPYPEVLELVDPVPKADACRLMREADGLLLLNPPSLGRYIQGKLYEYVASGTPILAFGAGGEMGGIISRLHAGITVEVGDSPGLADALQRLRETTVAQSSQRQGWLASRERSAQAAALFRELDALVDAASIPNT